MDPTKPILDLYSDSYYSNRDRDRQSKPQNYKSSHVNSYSDNSKTRYNSNSSQNYYRKGNQGQFGQLEVSIKNTKEKYQELYQAYKDKSSKLSMYEGDQDQLKNQNSRLRDQIDRLHSKNQELNTTLLNKNMELQDVYRKLQDELTNGGHSTVRGRGNEIAIDKLQDGLREAITSNYQILRESALAELKQLLH